MNAFDQLRLGIGFALGLGLIAWAIAAPGDQWLPSIAGGWLVGTAVGEWFA